MSSRVKLKGLRGVVQRHAHMLPLIKANHPEHIKQHAKAERALMATAARDVRAATERRKRKAAKQARKRNRPR